MVKQVKVIAKDTKELLFACDIADIEQAYSYAQQMEEMDLEVEVLAPTLTETLVQSLGLSEEEKEQYDESVFNELHDHEGSCCNKEDSEP